MSCADKEVQNGGTDDNKISSAVKEEPHESQAKNSVSDIDDVGTGNEPWEAPDTETANIPPSEDKWFLVAEITQPRVYSVFIDSSSVRDEESGEGKVSLSKVVFLEDQKDSDGLTYKEVHITSVIKCAARTYTYKTSKFYNSLGKLVYSENIGTNENEIMPNTVSAYVSDFICDYKPPEVDG